MSDQLIDLPAAEAAGWLVEFRGPWVALAAFGTNFPSGGQVVVGRRASRCSHGDYALVGRYDVFRFPIGWREGSISRALELPSVAKSLARKAMNRLP